MNKEIAEKYSLWSEKTSGNTELYTELKNIKDNEAEIFDRFYTELKFGTAGLRGIIGRRYKQNEHIYSRQSDSGTCRLYKFKKNRRYCGDIIRSAYKFPSFCGESGRSTWRQTE